MAVQAQQQSTKQKFRVSIARDQMSAMLVIFAPEPGEAPPSLDDAVAELNKAGVVYGILPDAIKGCIDESAYNNPFKAAQGSVPVKGENSKLTYNFNTSAIHSPHEDTDGRIDYKDISFIQNAEAGMVLATRTAPTAGVAGKNVLGKEINAPGGRDIPFKQGANTKISDDTMSLTATASGAIVYRNGEVSVKDVMVIGNDVDFNVGNLDCRGSLKVSGDIKAGFTVKTDGDLEVSGNVEDSTLMAKGNILVRGGFFGNGTGVMHADGNVTLKFAEGQKISAGGDITAGGELINCNIEAKGSVFVKGKKGKIVGGEIRAGKEIRASVLGSDAGTKTVLVVAYDSELMKAHHSVVKEISRVKTDGARIKDAMYGLYRLQLDGKLPPDKSAALDKLKDFHKELPNTIEQLEKQQAAIEDKIRELRGATVVAEERIYPGVSAHFGLVYREILEELKRCRLVLEGHSIVMSEFRAS